MAKYYVNKNAQTNGVHEVHKSNCKWLPQEECSHYLGEFFNCRDAVHEAKKTYSRADGCFSCSPACYMS